MKVWVVTHKVPGYDNRVCSVHLDVNEARAEVEHLDSASSFASAVMVERETGPLPRPLTPEQLRWLNR